MKKISYKKLSFWKHIVYWIAIGFLYQLIFPLEYPLKLIILRTTLDLFLFAFIYYSFYLFLAPYYNKQKLVHLGYTILFCFLFLIIFYVLDFGLPYLVYNDSLSFPPFSWIIVSSVYFFMIHSLAMSFYFNSTTIQDLKEESEKEKIALMHEILFINNQFNPHISFNFLSYCYRYMLEKDEISAKAIEEYSEMLRYSNSNSAYKTVSLSKEVNYIEQFISLQKKINNDVFVIFEKPCHDEKVKILPRVLITFIENAFKYGIYNIYEKPIIISIIVTGVVIDFKVINHKKAYLHNIRTTELGLINAKSQLDLFYKGQYKINIHNENDIYSVHLIINQLL